MATNYGSEAEIEDLTTCCICTETYGPNEERKPKFLPCSHTFCQRCLKRLVLAARQVSCPKCKTHFQLPGGSVRQFPTNVYALSIIQLVHNNTQVRWCKTCDCLPKSSCEDHCIIDRSNDVKEIQSLLVEVTTYLKEAVDKREQLKAFLATKMQAAMAPWLTMIDDNDQSLQKLRSMTDHFSHNNQPVDFLRMKGELVKIIRENKEELKRAERLMKADLSLNPTRDQVQRFISGGSKSKGRTSFEEISHRLPSKRPGPLMNLCSNLSIHNSCVNDIQFSDDGSFIVSAGDDKRILLWPTNEAMHNNRQHVEPTELGNRVYRGSILCLAVSPNNGRVFSGDDNGDVRIHDIQTRKIVKTFTALAEDNVWDISLQPGTDGNVFASFSVSECVVRICDVRCSSKGAAIQKTIQRNSLYSSTFSPVLATHLALAGDDTQIIDIRNPSRSLHRFPNLAISARYASNGSRILSKERDGPLSIYDLSSQQRTDEIVRVWTTSPEYKSSLSACCFAGPNDEYVVSPSPEHSLHLWSAQGTEEVLIDLDEPLLTLRGHKERINCVRYSTRKQIVASSGGGGVIILWKLELNH